MATGNATQPSPATEETRLDRQLKYQISVPFKLKDGTTIIKVCKKTSAEDSLFDNVGVTKITDAFKATAEKAVVYADNIKLPTAIRLKADGDNEGVSVSFEKYPALKRDKENWKVVRAKQTFPRLLSKSTTLYYATVNGLKIGRYGNTRTTAQKTDTNKYMLEAGMTKASKNDLPEMIMGCSFPRLPVATAPNGKDYPVDPTKIDGLPEGWIIKDLGSYTDTDFFTDIDKW
jgi:hypothetical protein